jgi:DNA-binding beta-propeller fold protein YncE
VGWALTCSLALLAGLALADAPAAEPQAIVYGPVLGLPFNGPTGIAIDAKRGEVLVANTGDHRIEIYSFQGRLRAHFTHKVRNRAGVVVPGQPAALLIDSAGHTLVVDKLATYVDVLDIRGRELARLDLARPGAGCPASNIVAGVVVAPSGEIFVASGDDTARVYRYDAQYRLKGWWDAAGAKGTRLSGLRGIAALPDGRLVLACSASKGVLRIFEPTGEFVSAFGNHEVGPGNFSNPSGLVVTADGRIWVCDEIRQSIQVFDTAGVYIGALTGAGDLNYPSALATDGLNYLAVTERAANRYQLLKLR